MFYNYNIHCKQMNIDIDINNIFLILVGLDLAFSKNKL